MSHGEHNARFPEGNLFDEVNVGTKYGAPDTTSQNLFEHNPQDLVDVPEFLIQVIWGRDRLSEYN
jgi:hypothetical protein